MSVPVLVLADIHGNFQALKAVLKDAMGLFGEIWVLGDIAGYGPDPVSCLDLLVRNGAVMIAGNHDRAVAGKADVDYFNDEARAAVLIHRDILDDRRKNILALLPETVTRRSVTLVHGSPDDPVWGYILDRSAAAEALSMATSSLTLTGHTHLPALWAYDPQTGAERKNISYGEEVNYTGVPHLANPGSVGQSRDGDGTARYMILNPERKTMEFRRCPWPRGPFLRKMRRGGYPESLIRRY
jgi:predicted phosphodiesterase